MNHYTPGDVIHATAAFSDPITREPFAPVTVTAKYIDPSGTVTPVTPYREDLTFAIDVATTVDSTPGEWVYRFESALPHPGAREGRFYLDPTAFP
jgi:hypothetical protein